MVTISLATTLPINPPSAAPVLTAEQMWQGLLKKCIRPQDFVSVMRDCEIESQTEDEIVRYVTLKEGAGPPGGKVKEIIRLATFHQPETSSHITNIISRGPPSTSEDSPSASEGPSSSHNTSQTLYLTFTFSWAHPTIKPHSAEEAEKRAMYEDMSAQTVAHTIEVVREMVGKGEI